MPKLVRYEAPAFPTKEARVAPGGSVTVEFTIAFDGSVSDPTIVASEALPTGDWFNSAVLEAAATWKFSGVKSACRGRLTVTFKLTE
jgi:TonB family protein